MINPYALRADSYLFGKLLDTRHLTIGMILSQKKKKNNSDDEVVI